jgi:Tfp pilus assembly protein PilO
MRFQLWKKEGILPLVLGLLALGAASYFLLFAPELRTIRELKAEIAAKETEVGEALKLRTMVAESRAGEAAKWEQRLRLWEERVPSAPETERMLAEVGELAVRHNLKAFGLAPAVADAASGQGAPPAEAEGKATAGNNRERMVESRYRVSFQSSYRDLAEFLDAVTKTRRLLTVRSVSVKEKSDAMVATVEFSAWHRATR